MSVLELIDDLEREARARSAALEHELRLPYGFTETHYPLTRREQIELNRLKHAGSAAADADTFLALIEGLPVHASRLLPAHRELVLAHRRKMDTG